MVKIRSDARRRIDEYIQAAPEFARPICRRLREIVRAAHPEIVEDWKWGPNFHKDGMVCGFGAFKKHVSFVFFEGALLKDPKGILTVGTSNRHNRSFRITSVSDIDEETLKNYIREAVALNENGIKASPLEKPPLKISSDIRRSLSENEQAKEFFEELAEGYQREYFEWINGAKRDETRRRRISQMMQKLAAGERLNEKYMKK